MMLLFGGMLGAMETALVTSSPAEAAPAPPLRRNAPPPPPSCPPPRVTDVSVNAERGGGGAGGPGRSVCQQEVSGGGFIGSADWLLSAPCPRSTSPYQIAVAMS